MYLGAHFDVHASKQRPRTVLSLRSSSASPPVPRSIVERRYRGVVDRYDDGARGYHVTYDDGDEEDLGADIDTREDVRLFPIGHSNSNRAATSDRDDCLSLADMNRAQSVLLIDDSNNDQCNADEGRSVSGGRPPGRCPTVGVPSCSSPGGSSPRRESPGEGFDAYPTATEANLRRRHQEEMYKVHRLSVQQGETGENCREDMRDSAAVADSSNRRKDAGLGSGGVDNDETKLGRARVDTDATPDR